jgi:hypothetical protein
MSMQMRVALCGQQPKTGAVATWFTRSRLATRYGAALLCLLCGTVLAQQAPNLNYTDDMPSVERVKAEIEGSDPTDTLARQTAVFTYLSTYIQRIKYNRTVRGPYTPDEARLKGAYELAAYQISQDYAKSHTPDEAKSFEGLHGRYELNPDFYDDWSKRLIGKQSAAAYKRTENELAARQQAHVAEEQRDFERDRAAQQAADRQIFGGRSLSDDPTAVAARRCLELGGTSVACVGKGFMSGFMDLIGFDTEALTGPGRAGVVLSGAYRSSAAGGTLAFDTNTVSLQDCGTLVAADHGYTVDKRPGSLRVLVDNEPRPIVLTMRPDEGLTGPGVIDVKGSIIIGYHTVVSTLYVDGHPAAGEECGAGPCQTTSTVPDYAPSTQRCSIGVLAAPPQLAPTAAPAASSAGLIGMLTGFANTIAPPAEPGLRMTGQYRSGTLLLDFSENSVILDCGAAHARQPYRVENGAEQLLIHVENSGGAFTLAMQPDNSLRGSGSTTVNGRLVSGMRGDDVVFTPRSERCDVDTFRPKPGAAAATSVSATPAASTTASGPRLAISTAFPAGPNPLAGHVVYLMKDRIDNVMRSVGAPIPTNATPGKAMQAWAIDCLPPNDCRARTDALSRYYVGKATIDSTGRALLQPQVPPGPYFVFTTGSGPGGVMVWDLHTDLKAGDNVVTLEAGNAEVLH